MKYVTDATQIMFLALGAVLLVVMVKLLLLDTRKKPGA